LVSTNTVEKELACIEQCLSLRRISVALAAPLVGLWVLYANLDSHRFEGMLPAELQTVGLANVSRETSRLGMMFTFDRYKSCGGATFSLTWRTLRAIKARRLASFDQARASRRVTNRGYRLAYSPWRETPVPAQLTDLGPWLGLNCMGWPWERRRILAAAREPGSYFTTTSNAELLVIPRLGIAVFTFYAF
jgi:hypothetical protein